MQHLAHIKSLKASGSVSRNTTLKQPARRSGIALRVYDLLPRDKRKEAAEIFARSGVNLDSVRKGLKHMDRIDIE